jgi:hypothetical protein
MRRRTLSKITTLSAFLGCLAIASSADALTLNNLSAAPANNDAGANSDISIHIEIGQASEDIRDLTIHLPPGVVGDPTGPEPCTEAQLEANACPAESLVGSSTAVANIVSLPLPQTVNGTVFNVVPRAGEPARFGIVLTAPVGPPVILQSPAKLRSSDFGLDSELKDLPNEVELAPNVALPIDITSLDITLFGMANDPPVPFMRNPTSCQQATTTFDATSYTGSTASGSASFTPDECAALDFSPNLDVELTAPPGANSNPKMVTTITQEATEAGLRRAEVKLPATLSADNDKLSDVCSVANFDAGTCAPEAIIGSAVASSPLLEEPLAGPVAIVTPPSPGLPDIGLDLRGPLALKLRGNLGFAPDFRARNVFDNLPDIPISEFTLTFNGGEGGFVEQLGSVCDGDGVFDTVFDGHNGEQTTGQVAATRIGCVAPTATARVRKPGSDAPRGRFVINAGDTPIESAEVRLSKQLRFARGKVFREGAAASDSSGPLPDSAIQRRRRSAIVTSDDPGGSDVIRLRAKKGALQSASGGKPSYEIFVTDAENRVTTLPLPLP